MAVMSSSSSSSSSPMQAAISPSLLKLAPLDVLLVPTVMASSLSSSPTGNLRLLGGGADGSQQPIIDAVVVAVVDSDSTVLFFAFSTFMKKVGIGKVRTCSEGMKQQQRPKFLVVPKD